MEFPESVKIGAHDWKVTINPNYYKDSGHTGTCAMHAQHIIIDGAATDSYQEEVLLHEIIEAINYMYELELPHNKITTLGNTLYQVLKENDINFREKE